MNTLVRLRGYITAIQLFKPLQHLIDSEPKYTLLMQPENPYILNELEDRIYQLREDNMRNHANSHRSDGSRWVENYESRVINNSEIYVESLFKPDLQGEFADYHNDDQLLGRFVQSVGHLYIHEIGIVCLSSHILEPAYQPNNEFEPYEISQSQ